MHQPNITELPSSREKARQCTCLGSAKSPQQIVTGSMHAQRMMNGDASPMMPRPTARKRKSVENSELGHRSSSDSANASSGACGQQAGQQDSVDAGREQKSPGAGQAAQAAHPRESQMVLWQQPASLAQQPWPGPHVDSRCAERGKADCNCEKRDRRRPRRAATGHAGVLFVAQGNCGTPSQREFSGVCALREAMSDAPTLWGQRNNGQPLSHKAAASQTLCPQQPMLSAGHCLPADVSNGCSTRDGCCCAADAAACRSPWFAAAGRPGAALAPIPGSPSAPPEAR